MILPKIQSLIASTESKGLVGFFASLTLAEWSSLGSFAAGVATAVYMARKTYLLKAAPVSANAND